MKNKTKILVGGLFLTACNVNAADQGSSNKVKSIKEKEQYRLGSVRYKYS